MDNITLKDVLGYGLQGFQTVVIWMLWTRLNQVTDRMFAMMEQAAHERRAIAQSSGLSTQNLREAANEIRKREGKSSPEA